MTPEHLTAEREAREFVNKTRQLAKSFRISRRDEEILGVLAPLLDELDAVRRERDDLQRVVDSQSTTIASLAQENARHERERDEARKEWDDEASNHASTLCELTEAQHAIVLLANQMERHSVPFVPETEGEVAKARRDQERMRRLDAIGQSAIAEAYTAMAKETK